MNLEVSLPADAVVERLRLILRPPTAESDAVDLLARPLYGSVSGRRFTARRAPLPWINLHGEFSARVREVSAEMCRIEIQRRGLDWGFLYSLVPIGAFVSALLLLQEPELAEIRALLVGLAVLSLGVAIYCVVVVLNDWRYLRGRLLAAFPETASGA